MRAYQLYANGRRKLTGEGGLIVSRKIFKKKKNAIDYKPKFREVVTKRIGKYDLGHLDKKNLFIRVKELELS